MKTGNILLKLKNNSDAQVKLKFLKNKKSFFTSKFIKKKVLTVCYGPMVFTLADGVMFFTDVFSALKLNFYVLKC